VRFLVCSQGPEYDGTVGRHPHRAGKLYQPQIAVSNSRPSYRVPAPPREYTERCVGVGWRPLSEISGSPGITGAIPTELANLLQLTELYAASRRAFELFRARLHPASFTRLSSV
jgi:hypothetical protein